MSNEMTNDLNRKLDWAIQKLNTAGFEEDSELYYNIADVVTKAKRRIKELDETEDELKLRMQVAVGSTTRRNEWTQVISAWIKRLTSPPTSV